MAAIIVPFRSRSVVKQNETERLCGKLRKLLAKNTKKELGRVLETILDVAIEFTDKLYRTQKSANVNVFFNLGGRGEIGGVIAEHPMVKGKPQFGDRIRFRWGGFNQGGTR